MQSQNTDTNLSVKELVDRYITARHITYEQYQRLSAVVLADGTVDDTERRQINRLFDAIQLGSVKIIN